MADVTTRFADVSKILTRTGPLANEGNFGTLFNPSVGFEPAPEVLQFINQMARVLVVGAGGLGCELLKDLALSGFGNIDVIDMDTIDISNLNRQFLFRKKDVGRPKATVAAEFVMKRVSGVTVTPHFCPIQDKDEAWYKQFQIIVMGLDSIEARRWLNAMVCSLVDFEMDGGVRKPGFEHLGAYVATRSAMRVLPALLVPCLVPRGTPADTAKEVRRLALHAARRARRVPPAVYTDGATCLGLSR